MLRGGMTIGVKALQVRDARRALGVNPSFKRVDTCAAEFEANTPYLYSSYDGSCEAAPTSNKKARFPNYYATADAERVQAGAVQQHHTVCSAGS